jgi:hypothetical protein
MNPKLIAIPAHDVTSLAHGVTPADDMEAATASPPIQPWLTCALEAELVTEANLERVLAYQAATAAADVIRPKVKAIQRTRLLEMAHSGHPLLSEKDGRPITTPEQAWMASREAYRVYCLEISCRERLAGIKPETMPDDYCPLLVAEHAVIKARVNLISWTAPQFGIEIFKVNPDRQKEWADLVSKLLLASPLMNDELPSVAKGCKEAAK